MDRENTNDNQFTTTTLEHFLEKYNSSRDKDIPELQKLFLSMDKKMHLYHANNYIITSFRLQDILVYSMMDSNGNTLYDVNFNKYSYVEENNDEMIEKNIFYAACLAVGTYNNCLSYIDPDHPDFLKGNFNLFAENMPSDVVPYYRGIIERGAAVYLESFDRAKKQRDIETMRREAEASKEAENKITMSPAKASKKNDKWGTSESAFVGISLFPFIIVLLGLVIPIIISLMA